MKEIGILAVLFLCLTAVPFESFSLQALIFALLETLVIFCFRYRQKKVLFYFFVLSLLANWGFSGYIEQFYRHIFPYFKTFGWLYSFVYFMWLALFEVVVILGEIFALIKWIKWTPDWVLLISGINLVSFFIKLLLAD